MTLMSAATALKTSGNLSSAARIASDRLCTPASRRKPKNLAADLAGAREKSLPSRHTLHACHKDWSFDHCPAMTAASSESRIGRCLGCIAARAQRNLALTAWQALRRLDAASAGARPACDIASPVSLTHACTATRGIIVAPATDSSASSCATSQTICARLRREAADATSFGPRGGGSGDRSPRRTFSWLAARLWLGCCQASMQEPLVVHTMCSYRMGHR